MHDGAGRLTREMEREIGSGLVMGGWWSLAISRGRWRRRADGEVSHLRRRLCQGPGMVAMALPVLMGRDLQLRGRISAWGYHSKAFLFLLSFVNSTLFGAVDVNDTWHACTHTSVATGKIAFWTGVSR